MTQTKKLWRTQKPSHHERTVMLRNCGKKCFLGTKKSFPICKKNTCTVSRQGLMAAYKRAREYRTIGRKKGRGLKKYSRIANRAKKMMN